MSNIKACLSKNSDDWRTPSFIYNHFINKGYKDLFPYKCPYNQYDLLYENDKLFINPPYSDLKNVIDYVIKLYKANNDIYLLIPNRTDTEYFYKLHKYCQFDIYFIKGRLHFNDSEKSAPFPSILLHINKYIIIEYFYLITPMEILTL